MESPKRTKDYREINARASFYAVLYPSFRKVAIDCGYALALHGSMVNDMDMIAVAWTEQAIHPDVLADRITKAAAATIYNTLWGKPGDKPHGRLAYTLNIMGDWYIDLSVIPPHGWESMPGVQFTDNDILYE